MIESIDQYAMRSLVESFETMAFLTPGKAENSLQPPVDPVMLTVRFTTESLGAIEMVAGRALGVLTASNMLGIKSPLPVQCDDALKELLNIAGGLMLRRWVWDTREQVSFSIPEVQKFDSADWVSFIGSPSAQALDVSGNLVGIRVCMEPMKN